MANPMLLWFVGYSNLTSIVIVTLCFVAMTIFIGFISMNGDYPGRSNIHIGIEQKDMVKMSNPFFLQLEHRGRKLEDGLHLRLSSLLPSKVFVIWGAKIQPIHDFILKPGRWIQKTFVFNKVEDFRELDVLHFDELEFPEAGDHSINLQCPDGVSSESLGSMPRKRYPVTVLIFVLENPPTNVNASSQNERSTYSDEVLAETDSGSIHSIIGLISIVHLQDDKVTQNSHVISQYVKTSGVPLYSLQPLYLSSDSPQSQPNHQNGGNCTAQQQNKNNRVNPGNCTAQQQSKNNRVNPGTASEKLQRSSISADCSSSSSSSSVGEISCLSRGCSQVKNCDSLLRKRDSHTFEDTKAGASDRCHNTSFSVKIGENPDIRAVNDGNPDIRPVNEENPDIRPVSDENPDIRPVNDENPDIRPVNDGNPHIRSFNQQCRDSGNKKEVQSKLLCDIKDNDKGTSVCQTKDQAECVVCQTHHVRCVLLPCRHACVCMGCFKLLYRCPMCRAGIESYFLLRNNLNNVDGGTDDEADEQSESDEEEMLQNLQHQAVNASFYQVWQRFNTRLNNILGYR